jgi:Zn-dependent protease with chaperone function
MNSKFKATFLLKLLILLGFLGIFLSVLTFFLGKSLSLWQIAVFVVLWLLTFEFELIPWFFEKYLEMRVEKSGKIPSRLFFYKKDSSHKKKEFEKIENEIENNPNF